MSRYGRIEPIAASHDAEPFDCGSEDQTNWLRRHALQAHRSDSAKVYVVCRRDTPTIVGYYALNAGAVATEDAPARVTHGTGRYPVPVIVLARLGVDVREQGRGLGMALVKDAFSRSRRWPAASACEPCSSMPRPRRPPSSTAGSIRPSNPRRRIRCTSCS